MTVIKAPFMSYEAHGTLASLLTYSGRRGRNKAGLKSNPRQPRTEAQRATRIFMAWLTGEWAAITPARKATWLNFADTPLLSPYHAYLSHNVNRIKNIPPLWGDPSLYPYWPGQAYPVTRTGQAANTTGETLTGGIGSATYTVNVLDKRDNWAIAFFRVKWAGEPPAYRRLIRIATVQTNGLHTIHIANLAPGPINIYCQRLTIDGLTTTWWSSYFTTIL